MLQPVFFKRTLVSRLDELVFPLWLNIVPKKYVINTDYTERSLSDVDSLGIGSLTGFPRRKS